MGYHGHLLPHLPRGAWPASSVCRGLSVHPLEMPRRQVRALGERRELRDAQVRWFGTPKKLCLLLVSHCQLLERVIPGKKKGVSQL